MLSPPGRPLTYTAPPLPEAQQLATMPRRSRNWADRPAGSAAAAPLTLLAPPAAAPLAAGVDAGAGAEAPGSSSLRISTRLWSSRMDAGAGPGWLAWRDRTISGAAAAAAELVAAVGTGARGGRWGDCRAVGHVGAMGAAVAMAVTSALGDAA